MVNNLTSNGADASFNVYARSKVSNRFTIDSYGINVRCFWKRINVLNKIQFNQKKLKYQNTNQIVKWDPEMKNAINLQNTFIMPWNIAQTQHLLQTHTRKSVWKFFYFFLLPFKIQQNQTETKSTNLLEIEIVVCPIVYRDNLSVLQSKHNNMYVTLVS